MADGTSCPPCRAALSLSPLQLGSRYLTLRAGAEVRTNLFLERVQDTPGHRYYL